MKKIRMLGIILSLCLVASLVITSCAPAATPPTTTPPTTTPPTTTPPTTTTATPKTQTPTAAPIFEPLRWHYASSVAKSFESWDGTVQVFWEELNRLTSNAVTIIPHHAGTMLSADDIADGIAAGLTDIAYLNSSTFVSRFPSVMITGVKDPVLSAKHDAEYWGYLFAIVAEEFWQKEFKSQGVKILYTMGTVENTLWTKKPVNRLADLKGMKIRNFGKYAARFVEAMGATPVPIAFMEYPDAIEKGMVDGAFSLVLLFYDAGMLGPTPYYLVNKEGADGTNFSLFTAGYVHTMSARLWDKLSDDWKRAVLQASKVAEENTIKHYNDANHRAVEAVKAKGATFTAIPADDWNSLLQHPLLATQWDDVAKEMDKAGASGTEQVARLFKLADMSDAEIKAIYEEQWRQRIAELW